MVEPALFDDETVDPVGGLAFPDGTEGVATRTDLLKYLIQYNPVPGTEKEMNFSPVGDAPNRRPTNPQLQPTPFFVTVHRNAPLRYSFLNLQPIVKLRLSSMNPNDGPEIFHWRHLCE